MIIEQRLQALAIRRLMKEAVTIKKINPTRKVSTLF